DRTFGERGAKSKQRSFDLMRVQVNLGVSKGGGKLLHAVGRTAFRQFIRKILCVICGTHRGAKGNNTSNLPDSVVQTRAAGGGRLYPSNALAGDHEPSFYQEDCCHFGGWLLLFVRDKRPEPCPVMFGKTSFWRFSL